MATKAERIVLGELALKCGELDIKANAISELPIPVYHGNEAAYTERANKEEVAWEKLGWAKERLRKQYLRLAGRDAKKAAAKKAKR